MTLCQLNVEIEKDDNISAIHSITLRPNVEDESSTNSSGLLNVTAALKDDSHACTTSRPRPIYTLQVRPLMNGLCPKVPGYLCRIGISEQFKVSKYRT
jgi:hypothetical protein